MLSSFLFQVSVIFLIEFVIKIWKSDDVLTFQWIVNLSDLLCIDTDINTINCDNFRENSLIFEINGFLFTASRFFNIEYSRNNFSAKKYSTLTCCTSEIIKSYSSKQFLK